MLDGSEQERKHICQGIGQRLKNSRKEKGLTLDDLAERTGFSKSYLSQIENLKREPSIGTLTKIAYALGLDAIYLISGVQPEAEESDFTLVRAEERRFIPDGFGQTGLIYESLAYKKRDRIMDAYLVEMGFTFPPRNIAHEGQEFVFTLEGTHEFVYDGKSYQLRQGDAYYFDASKSHLPRSTGSKPSKVLVVFSSKRGP